MWKKQLGDNLIKSVSISINGEKICSYTGDGKLIIQHEGNKDKCPFCKKIDIIPIQDFQELYGAYHKYVEYDHFYGSGIWKAYQDKNGRMINEILIS